MPSLKCKNHSPINKNIHGSLAEILEETDIGFYYITVVEKDFFISDIQPY